MNTIKKNKYFNYAINQEKNYVKFVINKKFFPKVLKIIPLGDVHVGAGGFNEKKFLETVKFIKEEPVLTYLYGDIIELALTDSPGNSIFEQRLRPREQMLYALDHLKPIKEKILISIVGNHEERALKKTDIDPMFWILKALNIEDRHSPFPFFATINFNTHNFNFFIQHGITNAKTEGGKINAASTPVTFAKYLNFITMGHVHDSQQAPIKHYRWIHKNGKFILQEYPVYVIIHPSFYEYWRTYAAKAGWRPPSSGIVCPRLWTNGDYDVSS